jgi:hypothetical protein
MQQIQASVQQIQRSVEPVLEYWLTKRRRQEFLASAGPALLCLTFLEDALRVLLRWTEQMQFMTKTMKRSAAATVPQPCILFERWQSLGSRTARDRLPLQLPDLGSCPSATQGLAACGLAPAHFNGHSVRGQRHDPATCALQAEPREDGLLHAARVRVCAAVHVRPSKGLGARTTRVWALTSPSWR